ncbi:MAG: hypothetical protein PHT91_00155 [Candidatus Nanoarchaeia archaeon]|nr:hypothetical protein [Candidatus Nanoarchaeia archaeon]MDD5054230.1 hypothetical protein [Candidatus Nanoarchaeia archaeon]MDD5499273.1 hypothetical protein [Candidatus Nanoarchaeia archaeon]
MGLEIHIFGINDRALTLPEWIDDMPLTHYQLQEIPATDEKIPKLLTVLNNRKADYFRDEESFVETVNDCLKKEVGTYVNPLLLRVAYKTLNKYDFCFPIGCLDEFDYKNPLLENILRFNRSVKITNNALNVLRNYNDILAKETELDENKYYEFENIEKLKKEFLTGKKMRTMGELIRDVMLYSGLEKNELSPKLAMEIIEGMIPASFSFQEEKVYLNPGTFRKVFSKTKKEFSPYEIVILVGEPHRIFLEHFLKKEHENVSSTPKTLDFLETNKEMKWVCEEIRVAEAENHINIIK